jgi:hypothetical protein
MAIVSIGSLLDRARRFEARLAKYYAAIRDETADNDVRLLTYCLSRHRRQMDVVLKDFRSRGLARVRKIRLRSPVDFRPQDSFGGLDTPPAEVKARDLLQSAVRYHAALSDLYKHILEQSVSDEASGLIEGLIRFEKSDSIILEELLASDYF